jgi:DNA-binding MarR family transcriptional regulator
MGIFGRMSRVSALLRKRLLETYKAHGLSAGDFDALATLRRSGPPHALSPTQLYRSSMLSSGTMTSRLDGMEKKGLVERRPDDADRRALKVHLTDQGMTVIEAVLEPHVALEDKLLGAFNAEERLLLESLLKRWVLSLGDQI